MMSPVSHLPLSLSLVASATTTPPRPLLVRSPTSSILSTPTDVFLSSSYLLHLSVAFYPVGHALFLEFLSLGFTTSLGPGFPSPSLTAPPVSSHLPPLSGGVSKDLVQRSSPLLSLNSITVHRVGNIVSTVMPPESVSLAQGCEF